MIQETICRWCKNKMKDACEPCTDNKRFESLEPMDVSALVIPELPRMRELYAMPPNERLALLYLHIVTIERTMQRSAGEYARNFWTQETPEVTKP